MKWSQAELGNMRLILDGWENRKEFLREKRKNSSGWIISGKA